MKKLQLLGAMSACLFAFTPYSATALTFDTTVTPGVIMGDGIGTGSWTVDTGGGVELGLRAKLRHNASGAPENTYNSNGDGTYSFAAGVAPTQSSPTAVWSFEWSINSDYAASSGNNLDDLTYVLGIDSNPAAASTFGTFDPVNGVNPNTSTVFWDHSLGTNATTSSTDSIATDPTNYATLIGANNVAQNSWKAHWFLGGGFDPTDDGQYDFYLAAYDGATEVARTDMSVIVGLGAPVPVPAAVWLFGSALGLLGWVRRRAS